MGFGHLGLLEPGKHCGGVGGVEFGHSGLVEPG